MSIAIASQNVNLTNAIPSATFGFGQPIYQVMVGFSFMKLAYGDTNTDNDVQLLSASLTMPTSADPIVVEATLDLHDNKNHELDPNNSSLTVSCMAVIGNTDSNASLSNQYGIAGGSHSDAVNLTYNPDMHTAVLSGFKFDFGDDHHHVKTITALSGTGSNAEGCYITSTAALYDDSDNYATSQIDGGLFLYSGFAASNLMFKTITVQSSDSYSVPFDEPIRDAVVFVQGFTVSYGSSDNKLGHLAIGPTGYDIDAGNNAVVLTAPRVVMHDDSENYQLDTDSSVTLLIICTKA